MKRSLSRMMLMAALANAATLASFNAPYGHQQEVRHYRPGKRLQTPEEKKTALAQAEEKRERKRSKRASDYLKCLFRNALLQFSCNYLYHWQFRRVSR